MWLQCCGSRGRSWGLWSRPPEMVQAVAGSGSEVGERASLPRSIWGQGPHQITCSSKSQALGFFLVLRERWGQGRGSGRAEAGEPLLLPLLHVLHLQAEGREAGQEVGHFIHLWDKTKALSQVP